jgi:hypothetical protein
MRQLMWILSGLVCGLFTAIVPGLAADAPGHSHSALDSLAALEKPVSYSETKIPLGELVQKVAADTGVTLTASAAVADEPVAVVVKDLLARELLEQLADLLDYQWMRSPQHRTPNTEHPTPAFEIYQDVASKQREEALRQAAEAEIRRRFQEELSRYLEVAALSQDEMKALWDEEKRRGQKMEPLSPEAQRALASSPDQKAWNRRASLIFPLWSPIARAVTRVVGQINDRQWATLLQEGELVFSTDPKSGELPLPAEAARTLREARPSLNPPDMYSPGEPETEQRMRQWEQEGQSQWAQATGYRVRVDLDANRLEREGTLSLGAAAEPIRSAPGVMYGAAFGLGNVLGAGIHISAQASDPLQHLSENQSPERQAALEQDPVVGTANRRRVTSTARPRPMNGIPEVAWRWWLRNLLPTLAQTYHVQFISDAYWNHAAEVSIRDAAAAPTPLFRILDGAPSFTHRWERRGPVIRLRGWTWFLDRPKEIPLRLVRRWKSLDEARGALPLEEYLSMVGQLSDPQMAGLDDVASQAGLPADMREDFYLAFTARKELRLYASLGEGQRRDLWRGQPLPVARMLPAQRALLFSLLKERNRGRTPPLDLTSFAGARLALVPRPFCRVITAARGIPVIHEEKTPEEGGPALPVGEVAPGVWRFPVTRLWFEYQTGDQKEPLGLVFIISPGTSVTRPPSPA